MAGGTAVPRGVFWTAPGAERLNKLSPQRDIDDSLLNQPPIGTVSIVTTLSPRTRFDLGGPTRRRAVERNKAEIRAIRTGRNGNGIDSGRLSDVATDLARRRVYARRRGALRVG
ncbi:unnamed protein product, partial [Iphiclides podalirius]